MAIGGYGILRWILDLGMNKIILYPSDGQTEDSCDTVHRFVLPPDGAAAIRRVVPVAGAGSVQTRSVLLHDHARHHVFERLV